MRRPLVHELYEKPLSGEKIETESLASIEREVPPHSFTPPQWEIVRRMIHATADFRLLEDTRFSPEACSSGVAALRSARPIYADSRMICAGISLHRLRSVNADYSTEHIRCHVSDADVAEAAQSSGLPRSLFAVRKARDALDGSIVLFGNAPVGLMELSRLVIEDGVRPALVVAMPVGFVHVVDSKEEFMVLGVPFIAVSGRRGGSPIAVSVVHALCSLAASVEPAERMR